MRRHDRIICTQFNAMVSTCCSIRTTIEVMTVTFDHYSNFHIKVFKVVNDFNISCTRFSRMDLIVSLDEQPIKHKLVGGDEKK